MQMSEDDVVDVDVADEIYAKQNQKLQFATITLNH